MLLYSIALGTILLSTINMNVIVKKPFLGVNSNKNKKLLKLCTCVLDLKKGLMLDYVV